MGTAPIHSVALRFPPLRDLLKGTEQKLRRATPIFCAAEPLRALSSFIHARQQRVAPSTIVKDLGALRWAAPRMMTDPAWPLLLTDLSRSFRALAARTMLTKALPLRPQDLPLVEQRCKLRRTRLLLRLVWRTASRVNDVVRLTDRDISVTTVPPILTVVFPHTKANDLGGTRLDHRVVIERPGSLAQLQSAAPRGRPLFDKKHVSDLDAALLQTPVCPNWADAVRRETPSSRFRHHYTRHSLKRGAARVLIEAAARGAVSLQLVQQLLKHRNADSTVGYAGSPTLLALAAGVHNATRLL